MPNPFTAAAVFKTILNPPGVILTSNVPEAAFQISPHGSPNAPGFAGSGPSKLALRMGARTPCAYRSQAHGEYAAPFARREKAHTESASLYG